MNQQPSPFSHMARVLAGRNLVKLALPEADVTPHKTLTASIRELIRQHGPLSSTSIAATLEMDGPAGLVYALLKNDLQKGQVEFSEGLFYWNHAHDAAKARQISQAAALLRKHGWKLTAPKATA